MSPADQLKVDADYLARCLASQRASGVVRIPVASADVLLRNYVTAIEAMSPADGTLNHPQATSANPFAAGQLEASAKMDEATAAMSELLKKKPETET